MANPKTSPSAAEKPPGHMRANAPVQPMPAPLRRLLKVTAWVVGVLATLYLGLATWIWNWSPGPTLDLEVRLRERLPVDPSGTYAWPAYKQALWWQRATHDATQEAKDLRDAIGVSTEDPKWKIVRDAVANHATDMAALRAAALVPLCGYTPKLGPRAEDAEFYGYTTTETTVQPGTPAMAILLPNLSTLRTASRLLRADAIVASEAGDGARAVEDLSAMLGVARHSGELGFFICHLVEFAIRKDAYETITRLLDAQPDAFSAEQLAQLAALIGPGDGDIVPHLTLQREGAKETLQRIFTDDGHSGGRLLLGAYGPMREWMANYGATKRGQRLPPDVLLFLGAPVLTAVAPTRAEVEHAYMAAMDEIEVQAALPAWKQKPVATKALRDAAASGGTLSWMAYYPLLWGTTDLSTIARDTSSARSARDFARVRVAVERFHRERGTWPQTLDEIVPAYLPSVPNDEAFNEPFTLGFQDGKPVLKSAPTKSAPAKTAAEVAPKSATEEAP